MCGASREFGLQSVELRAMHDKNIINWAPATCGGPQDSGALSFECLSTCFTVFKLTGQPPNLIESQRPAVWRVVHV